MNRRDRRRVQRLILKLGERDHCTSCGDHFQHAGMTFGGVTRRGEAALVCERCIDKLEAGCVGGLYFHGASRPIGTKVH